MTVWGAHISPPPPQSHVCTSWPMGCELIQLSPVLWLGCELWHVLLYLGRIFNTFESTALAVLVGDRRGSEATWVTSFLVPIMMYYTDSQRASLSENRLYMRIPDSREVLRSIRQWHTCPRIEQYQSCQEGTMLLLSPEFRFFDMLRVLGYLDLFFNLE